MNYPANREDARKLAAYVQRSLGPITDPTQIDEWPEQLHPLLDQFGPRRVWDAGFLALGYPATWVRTNVEANQIGHRLTH